MATRPLRLNVAIVSPTPWSQASAGAAFSSKRRRSRYFGAGSAPPARPSASAAAEMKRPPKYGPRTLPAGSFAAS